MSTNCFLCLQICRTRRCKICSLVSHKSCWVEFEIKSTNPGHCPQCRSVLDTKVHNTRTNTRVKKLNEQQFVIAVRKCLSVCNNVLNRSQKEEETLKLYTIIAENKWYLEKNSHFNEVSKNKLISFIQDDNWLGAIPLYERIWGV